LVQAGRGHAVCPWYLGYVLVNPLRKLFESPERLLRPLVRPGMTVLEPGCGMGYFSLPLARLVGPTGRVVCVDLQPKMLDGLRKRARRAGLLDRIEAVQCEPGDLRLQAWTGRVDLALAIHVVHEVPDQASFLRQIHAALRPGGSLLVREPKGHVTPEQFEVTVKAARAAGFTVAPSPIPSKGPSALLTKAA
jgi:ubiquinone/menaquinone biosynthesis C-methylase UbiE